MIETVPVGLLWRALSFLPAMLLRRFFSKDALAKRVTIDVRSRGDQVVISGGELPGVQIWLVVANRGHFKVTLDRLTVQLAFGAMYISFPYLERKELDLNGEVEVPVRGALTTEQLNYVKRNLRAGVSLDIHAEFNAKVHNFSVQVRGLPGIRPLINLPETGATS